MNDRNIEEKVLIERLRNGDHEAFKTLYSTHATYLYRKLIKFIKSKEDADEILQDLFVKVWERRRQIDPLYPFSAYLYRVAQRMIVDYYRKIARTEKAHTHLFQANPKAFLSEDPLEKKETLSLLEEAIQSLPTQRKQAFLLCKIEGKSHKDAAEIMKISPNTVHNHLSKATDSIKKYLSKIHFIHHFIYLPISSELIRIITKTN